MTSSAATAHREDGHGGGTHVRVHYWAAARAAAGVAYDDLPADGPLTLAEVRDAVVARHDTERMRRVLDVCSVLVGDRPVGTADPAEVRVAPGESVQYLPPFAGG